MSVANVLSCASSRIMVEYLESMLSFIASLNNIPSVMYFKNVLGEVMSSNRIEYPTSWPSWTALAEKRGLATLWEARGRGEGRTIHFVRYSLGDTHRCYSSGLRAGNHLALQVG